MQESNEIKLLLVLLGNETKFLLLQNIWKKPLYLSFFLKKTSFLFSLHTKGIAMNIFQNVLRATFDAVHLHIVTVR